MAITAVTPRDRLQRLADLGRKTLRYWWLVAIFAVVGGALSLAFAVLRPKKFQTWTTLSYEELIKSDVMSPGREQISQRNIGDKYRELLLARGQLAQIIGDPALNPFPSEASPEVAIDKLREVVKLESRGGNTLRIVYTDGDPDRAKAVADKLTALLRSKDEWLANESAQRTVEFATRENESASAELKKREQGLNKFLAEHPEFAQDAQQGNSEGAGIRASNTKPTPAAVSSNPRLRALERQRARIQARLDAPPDAPIKIAIPPTPERIAAEAAVADAQRELAGANRALEDALSKYTEKHPAAKAAADRRDAAQQRVRQAQAAVPPSVETQIAPATPQDRTRLEGELKDIEAQMARAQTLGAGTAAAPVDASTDRVVGLETEHAKLRRDVAEQRERVEALATSVFRAQMDVNQKQAEQSRLAVIDAPFTPVKPSGPGKTIFLMAGMALFLALGVGLAVGLALLDDRVFRRHDLDDLGISVLAVIPADTATRRSRRTP